MTTIEQYGCVPLAHVPALRTLGADCMAVYIALQAHCRGASHRTCWPSLSTIAELIGADRSNVARAVRKLESTALVERVERPAGGKRRSTRYNLPMPSSGVTSDNSTSVTSDNRSSVKSALQVVSPATPEDRRKIKAETRATRAACEAAPVARSGPDAEPDPEPDEAPLPIDEQIAAWRGIVGALAAGKVARA